MARNREEERRGALKIIGAIGSTCLFPFQADELYGQHEQHGPGKAVPAPPTQRQFFKEQEFALLSEFVDVIIPPTSTPGASQAGVPGYIDAVAFKNARLGATLRAGLGILRKKKFQRMDAAGKERVAAEMCEAAEKAKSSGPAERFWVAVKNLTADGYYTSEAGMRQELGYQGSSVLESFPSCESVPEH